METMLSQYRPMSILPILLMLVLFMPMSIKALTLLLLAMAAFLAQWGSLLSIPFKSSQTFRLMLMVMTSTVLFHRTKLALLILELKHLTVMAQLA